jgi:cytochrome P450
LATPHRIPSGPPIPYNPQDDLFTWMTANFFKYGDIYKASIYRNNVYVVSAPDFCERILRLNWRNYERKGLVVQRISIALGNCLITSNGEFWVSQRRMVQTAFTRDAVLSLGHLIGRLNLDVIEKWKKAASHRENVNVTQDISRLVLKVTLLSIFGDDYETLAPQFDSFVETSLRDFKFAQDVNTLRQLVLQVLTERRRRQCPAADILAKLMQARNRDTNALMSDPQLVREVLTLVVAGHETTASLLNWLWYLIAAHPDVESGLIDEFTRLPWDTIPAAETLPNYVYARQVIDEALRLYPPLWLMTRRAVADDRLGEFFVPAGTEIYISPYLIQHNPSLWEAPEEFAPGRMSREKRPERELAFCPFGGGPRNCIGEFFARLEIQLHLMMVLRELRLRQDAAQRPEITTGINLLNKHDFIMAPEVRAPGRK